MVISGFWLILMQCTCFPVMICSALSHPRPVPLSSSGRAIGSSRCSSSWDIFFTCPAQPSSAPARRPPPPARRRLPSMTRPDHWRRERAVWTKAQPPLPQGLPAEPQNRHGSVRTSTLSMVCDLKARISRRGLCTVSGISACTPSVPVDSAMESSPCPRVWVPVCQEKQTPAHCVRMRNEHAAGQRRSPGTRGWPRSRRGSHHAPRGACGATLAGEAWPDQAGPAVEPAP